MLLYYLGDTFWVPVHPAALYYASLKYSLAAAAGFLLLAASAIKGESGWDARSCLITVLCAAAFAAAGALGFQVYNGVMDKAGPESHVVEVESKLDACRGSGRGSRCRYLVEVMGWRQGIESYMLSVPRGEFARAQVRQKYEVVTKAGALGFEWIFAANLRN